jgi:hypothetical protein
MNNHLSFSQRKILSLEARLATLELMQVEYNTLLNYIVEYHGKDGVFTIHGDKLKTLEIQTIRTECKKDLTHGQIMSITRVGGGNHEASRIVTI